MIKEIEKYAEQYRKELLESVIPFWLRYSQDKDHGGFFTCLDRKGNVYDTDKFMWLQGREVWLFSMLYNRVEKNSEWLEMAVQGAEFMKEHGMDAGGNWYFSLTQEGKPLVQPYNIFSDCFAAMAFGQLSRATGNDAYADIAVRTFENILKRRDNPKGKYNKAVPGTRPGKGFALPMILSNLVLEIEDLVDPSLVEKTVSYCRQEISEVFYQPQYGLLTELTNPDGSFQDSIEGRLVIPGHSLEAMWFLMDLAERNGDKDLISWAVDTSMNILDYGWDSEFGGILYMMDIKGYPIQMLEWDQKLWWVHQEAILALLKGFMHTGDNRCMDWFQRLHDYAWSHFSDREYGEWFGYLNRRGEVLIPLKGGKWKGCFHTPRFLYQGWKTLEKIIDNNH